MAKYNINKEFGFYAKFNSPFLKALIPFSQGMTKCMWRCLKKEKDITYTDVCLEDSVEAFLIEPRDADEDACLLYFHGGAFAYDGSKNQYQAACEYARQLKRRVLFVRYSLTPKFTFPKQENEAKAALMYVSKQYSKIGIGGDSAGGYLAIKTMLEAVSLGIDIQYLMLIYPVVDNLMRTDSMKKYTDTPMWNAKNNRRMWQWYYAGADFDKSLLDTELPEGIPPTYVEVTEYDCLHDEGLLLANKLKEQGVAVTINEIKGAMHGFDIKKCETTSMAMDARLAFMKMCV